MKKLCERNLLRRAESLEESRCCVVLAQMFEEESLLRRDNLNTCRLNLNEEEENASANISEKDKQSLSKKRGEIGPLTDVSAADIKKTIEVMFGGFDNINQVEIIPYNKKGLSETVTQKADIAIKIWKTDSSCETVFFSLKQYAKLANPQVASGTWLSTLCGLFFVVVGRGKFKTSTGEEFLSKDYKKVKKYFIQYYNIDITPMLALTREVQQLRYEEWKPDNWTEITKLHGNKAAEFFETMLTKVIKENPDFLSILQSRFLSRAGLDPGATNKVLSFSAFDKNGIKILNSYLNPDFKKLYKDLATSILKVYRYRQAIRFAFTKNGKEILIGDMPLTINSNGAWANKTGFHKGEKLYLREGERRPKKSMQLDTSTNVWLKLKTYYQPI
jgi:hypothetical protein